MTEPHNVPLSLDDIKRLEIALRLEIRRAEACSHHAYTQRDWDVHYNGFGEVLALEDLYFRIVGRHYLSESVRLHRRKAHENKQL